MAVHIIFIIVLFLVYSFTGRDNSDNSQLARKRQVTYMGFLLFLFSALRSPIVGVDILGNENGEAGYYLDYSVDTQLSFSEIFVNRAGRDPVFHRPLHEFGTNILDCFPLSGIEVVRLQSELFGTFGMFRPNSARKLRDVRGDGEVRVERDNGDIDDLGASQIKPGRFEVNCGKDVHGLSPLLRSVVSDRNLRDPVSSVFSHSEHNIAHNTAI